MIYTIIPIDAVLENQQGSYEYVEKKINGELVQINKNSDNNYSLMRVITTNPNVFLQQEFQPGTAIIY